MKRFDFKIALKKTKHAFKDIGSDADKDWKIVLISMMLLFVLCVILHVKVFLEVQNVKKQGGQVDSAATELINTKALEDVLSMYDERAESFEALSVQEFTFVDPAR